MISKSQLKYIQSLGQKKYRDEEGLFIAEGPKLVEELIKSKNVAITHIYALDCWINEHEAMLAGIDATAVERHELERVSQLTTPNKVLAVARQFETTTPGLKGQLVLALDAIRDPGNLGTIIRNADWFNVQQIICSEDCADLYNPKVVQATMGSIARVKIFYCDLAEWLPQRKTIKLYATVLDGKNIMSVNPVKEGIVLIGNESSGIRSELIALADEKITIPRKGNAESLNAAVASGIILSRLAG